MNEKNLKDVPNESLKEWFLKNRRDFPWRRDPSPYRVWISEVMLQQQGPVLLSPILSDG